MCELVTILSCIARLGSCFSIGHTGAAHTGAHWSRTSEHWSTGAAHIRALEAHTWTSDGRKQCRTASRCLKWEYFFSLLSLHFHLDILVLLSFPFFHIFLPLRQVVSTENIFHFHLDILVRLLHISWFHFHLTYSYQHVSTEYICRVDLCFLLAELTAHAPTNAIEMSD